MSLKRTTLTPAYCVLAFLTLFSSVPVAGAQTLERVGTFWGFTDVQFLPGAYVEENSDGDIKHYHYAGSKFEIVKHIPAVLSQWSSFGGGSDYLDQVDASGTLLGNLRALVPKRARVKKYYEVTLPAGSGAVAVICYTLALKIEGANAKEVFVAAALHAHPEDTRSEYTRLWTRKVASEANYGDFQYQLIPGAGAFFLLYSDVIGGDAIEHHLDVYRMRALDQPAAVAKHDRN